MTGEEQQRFNEKCAALQAYEWRDRTIRRLIQKIEPLSSSDTITLLRKVDELLT